MKIRHHKSTARMSEAVVLPNGLIFLSGQVPTNAASGAGIRAQTENVLEQIDEILAGCGSDKTHICEAVVYLADMNDYAAMNEVWDRWVSYFTKEEGGYSDTDTDAAWRSWSASGQTPPRTCVQSALANPDWKIEIRVTAVRK